MKYKILFRCDAAYIKGIGSGHLIRCVVIAKILEKKFGFKKKEILFITKSKEKYELSKKILNKNKYNYLSISNSISKKDEINLLSKFKSRLLIVDKYKFYDSKNYIKIIKNFNKVIFIDSYKRDIKNVYYLNPTFSKVEGSKSPILIIPSLLQKNLKKNIKEKINNIFVFFGNFDFNNLEIKVIKILQKIGKFNIFSSIQNKAKLKKFKYLKFVEEKNFFKNMKNCDLAITSGGLVMYDVMNLNIPLIIVPQIRHQNINSKYYEKKKSLIKVLNNKNLYKNLINKIKLINDRKLRNSMVNSQKKIFSTKERKKIYYILKKCI
tara:strand:+ start:177 stop:1142 length:966 start_codon:yes stop_codon:yes gene_type:complete